MEESPWNNGRGWKWLLALLLVTAWIGMGTTFYLTMQRAARVTDPDSYRHAQHYGRTENGAPNPGMSWRMATVVKGGELRVSVRDESGAPVAGGALRFEPERLGIPAGTPLTLAESAPGTFRTARPEAPEGELHGTLRFTRGEAVATQKLVLFN